MIKEIVTYYFDEKTKKEVYFVDEENKKQDKCIRYYFNGEICEIYYFVDNIMQGDYKRYARTGLLESNGGFVDGKKEGKWLKFNNDGFIREIKFYIFGKDCDEQDYKKIIARKRLNLI